MRSSDLTQFLTLDVFHQDTAIQNHCLLSMLFTLLCLPNISLIRYFDILTNTCTGTHQLTMLHKPSPWSTSVFDLELWPLPWCWPLTFDLDPWPLTSKQGNWWQTVKSKYVHSLFDLNLWPTALTYIASLANKKYLHANGLGGRVVTDRRTNRDRQTNRQTDGRTTPSTLSPSLAVYNKQDGMSLIWCNSLWPC